MSDFILEYDILESIAKYSNSLGKRSEEYGASLESRIISAIGSVTGSSSGYLTSASDLVRDKINALKQKSEAFYHFAEQILNLLEVAEQIDQEVADAIAAGRENFLDHHESLRIDDWKAKLLGLYVDIKNSIPLLGTIADILDGMDTLFESLKDSIKHWYECEGGKYIVEAIGAVVAVKFVEGLLALAIIALVFTGASVFTVCGVIAVGIALVNAVTNVATSFRAVDAAIDGNPAWAVIYGMQDTLSDVLRQKNFGSGIWNDLSNVGAGVIDITETVCVIIGIAEAGIGIAKLFKGDAFKLLKNKGVFNISDLKSGLKNGIVDLKSNIKQGYANLKNGIKGLDKAEDIANEGNNAGKLSKNQIEDLIDEIGGSIKNHPLRQEYENAVKNLCNYEAELRAQGLSQKEIAETLYKARRDLGVKYKNLTPDALREYIYEINRQRYGDELGASFDFLVNKYSLQYETMDEVYEAIIKSSQRPNSNVDKLLQNFKEWLIKENQ